MLENYNLLHRLRHEDVVDWESQFRTPLQGFTSTPRPLDDVPPFVWHGTWNYTIRPTSTPGFPTSAVGGGAQARAAALELLADPALTGMTRDALVAPAARLAPTRQRNASAATSGSAAAGADMPRVPMAVPS
ncbi:hypothetical protein GCM10023080_078400 [Streptomyces pseudoechinosporeus]